MSNLVQNRVRGHVVRMIECRLSLDQDHIHICEPSNNTAADQGVVQSARMFATLNIELMLNCFFSDRVGYGFSSLLPIKYLLQE